MKWLPSPLKVLKNQRGIALMMAIFTFVLVSSISMELLEETQVEYITASQGVNRLKAYYAAKTGVELGLLRILIYKKALALAGDAIPDPSILTQIWQFPFVWPPVLGDNISRVSRDLVETSVKESLIDTQIAVTISSEGSKIDINDLGSPSKALAESTHKQILRIFENKVQNDEAFEELYGGFDFNELVNNLADWVDEDRDGRNRGDEASLYAELKSEELPPNQPFKTIKELHMVAGMTDDLYEVLAPHITVYGVAGIQVNSASKEVLRSIDAEITEEVADEILKHIADTENGGPFSKEEDFIKFVQDQGVELDSEKLKENGIPLIFGTDINFRLVANGAVGNTTREIVAIVYDFDTVKARLKDIISKDTSQNDDQTEDDKQKAAELAEECKDEEGDDKFECLCREKSGQEKQDCISAEKKKAESGNSNGNQKKDPPKGRPNVVYWHET